MSEKMIELQRLKLGLPRVGPSQMTSSHLGHSNHNTISTTNNLNSNANGTTNNSFSRPYSSSAAAAATAATTLTPSRSRQLRQQQQQCTAAARVMSEEEGLKVFLQNIQMRDDSHPRSMTASTVPTALARRMLQRQGVGYLDDSVSALVSAAADRFLATVLQQAMVCRDQRLQGADQLLEASRKRHKWTALYKSAANVKRRKKQAQWERQQQQHLAAIAAASNNNNNNSKRQKGGSNHLKKQDAETSKSKKKKKKQDEDDSNNNNNNNNAANKQSQEQQQQSESKKDASNDDDDDLSSVNSLEYEEQYYSEYYGDLNGVAKKHAKNNNNNNNENDEDDEESKFVLQLRDLERPLQAWDFPLTGKIGLGVTPFESAMDEAEKIAAQDVDDDDDDVSDGLDDNDILQQGFYSLDPQQMYATNTLLNGAGNNTMDNLKKKNGGDIDGRKSPIRTPKSSPGKPDTNKDNTLKKSTSNNTSSTTATTATSSSSSATAAATTTSSTTGGSSRPSSAVPFGRAPSPATGRSKT